MEKLLSEGIKATPPSFVRGILKAASDPEIISFAGGLPNPISFPQEELLDSMQRIVKTYGSKVFQYAITAGLPELRQYIAERYNRKFGLNLTIDNIIITTGSQQALDLIAKVLLDQGGRRDCREAYLSCGNTSLFLKTACVLPGRAGRGRA